MCDKDTLREVLAEHLHNVKNDVTTQNLKDVYYDSYRWVRTVSQSTGVCYANLADADKVATRQEADEVIKILETLGVIS